MLNQVGSPPALLEATYTMKHKKLGYTWDDILDYLRKEFHTKDVMLASCNGGGIEDGLAYENNDPRIQDIGETPFPDIGFTVHCLDSGKISDAGCDVAYGFRTGTYIHASFLCNIKSSKLQIFTTAILTFQITILFYPDFPRFQSQGMRGALTVGRSRSVHPVRQSFLLQVRADQSLILHVT